MHSISNRIHCTRHRSSPRPRICWAIIRGIAVLAITLLQRAVPAGTPALHPTRASFVSALARVAVPPPEDRRRAMTTPQIIAVLGKPDDVIEAGDAERLAAGLKQSLQPGEKLLRWGTSGHGTLPTLGEVGIDAEGRVMSVRGGWGAPPPSSTITETELRRYLRLLEQMPDPYAQTLAPRLWDPLAVIQISHELRPLGKEKILAILTEYARINGAIRTGTPAAGRRYRLDPGGYLPSRDDAMLALMAVLFVSPSDAQHYSWANVVGIEQDIPLLIPGSLGPLKQEQPGTGQVIVNVLPEYRTRGVLRPKALRPPDRPLELVAHLEGRPTLDQSFHRDLRNQFLRLVAPAYKPSADLEIGPSVSDEVMEQRWKGILSQEAVRKLYWDPVLGRYVLSAEKG